jgi:predicted metal-dependent hydrolase
VLWLFYAGTRFMLERDPTLTQKATWQAFFAGQRRGVLPRIGTILGRIPLYLQPGYHPRELGSIPRALQYLAGSSGVLAGANTSRSLERKGVLQ